MESYRTKRGSISFGSERVMMEETLSGYIKNFVGAMWYEGGFKQNIVFTFILAIVLYSIELVFFFFLNATFEQKMLYTLSLLSIMVLVLLTERYRGFTDEKFIEFDKISSIELIEGKKWLTCPRFIIEYEDKGKDKKRYVTMPSHILPGVDEDIEKITEEFESRDIEVR